MTITFDHTIIASRDRTESARFHRDLVELAEAPSWARSRTSSSTTACCCSSPNRRWRSAMQHYAFLVDDELFDRAYRRLVGGGVEHWADPQLTRPGETNTEHGGRGVYFLDPAGHGLEMITRPYL